MARHHRLTAAVSAAALAVSFAGPAVTSAFAAAHHTSRPHVSTPPPPDSSAGPVSVLNQVAAELEFDLSPGNIQAILDDFPGFGPYGSLTS